MPRVCWAFTGRAFIASWRRKSLRRRIEVLFHMFHPRHLKHRTRPSRSGCQSRKPCKHRRFRHRLALAQRKLFSGLSEINPNQSRRTMTTLKTKSTALNKIVPRAALCTMASATALSLTSTALKAEDPPSRIHELINLEFSSEYVTPRGMMVHQKGLTFQPLALTLVNVYHGESFVNDFTLVAGAWNDFGTAGVPKHAPGNGGGNSIWTEIDPIAGISLGFAKNFKLDVTYSAFAEQILDIGTSQNLEIKLSYDDTEYL